MPLSLRQRREITARQFLSISIEPQSDGLWKAILMEDGKALYASAAQWTPEEALPFAAYELGALVDKRVDAIEAADVSDEPRMHAPTECHGAWL